MNLYALKAAAANVNTSTDFENIDEALIDWAFDGADYDAADAGDVLNNAIRTLECCDCAGCSAPGGLIYNSDLARKLGEWAFEIDAALDAYHDSTGERFQPKSVFSLVWFAVEWRAHELASLFESERESILEGLESQWSAGWNMPGYMPDSEPSQFESWSDARDYIAGEIERARDESPAGDTDEGTSDFDEALAALEALEDGEEFGRTVGGYHYWVTRA